jgi:hypothetical protein
MDLTFERIAGYVENLEVHQHLDVVALLVPDDLLVRRDLVDRTFEGRDGVAVRQALHTVAPAAFTLELGRDFLAIEAPKDSAANGTSASVGRRMSGS